MRPSPGSLVQKLSQTILGREIFPLCGMGSVRCGMVNEVFGSSH